MPGFGPIASLPIASTARATNITVSGSLYSPATLNAVYPGSTFFATGGTAPYTYAAFNLPAGLSINSSTGIVSGTDTAAAGSYPGIYVQATDSLSNVGVSPTFTLVILPPGVSKWPGHAPRLRAFWYNPARTLPGQGFPPVAKRAQTRRKKSVEFNPGSGLQVNKFNTYSVLSPPDNSLSLIKFNVYFVLETVPGGPKPVNQRRHPRAKAWRWTRPQRRLTGALALDDGSISIIWG